MSRRDSGKCARQSNQVAPRVRLRLLLLLWVWAIVMFLVVDLFRNAPELDAIRPRSTLYNAARGVAHRLIGESVETVVVGTVVDTRGQPIAGALVVAAAARAPHNSTGPSADTDQRGGFDLALGTAPSWDSVVVSAQGYQPTQYYIVSGFQRVTIVLQYPPVIRGCVGLSEGGVPREFEVIATPVARESASVPPGPFGTVFEHGDETTCFSGGPNNKGDFLIRGLQAVPYCVIVRAPGRAVVRLTGVLPGPGEAVEPIKVSLPPVYGDEK